MAVTHHHDQHQVGAQPTLGEQGAEGFQGGGVCGLHGSKFCLREPLNTTQLIRGPL
ncbi:hypothetical protein [Variovorax sp. ZT5P49]|uniref:hypothetical protein n=1 Tax=Variovorax sp. ZT5P49 TaxID=3443733 RepID=UPI003F497579